MSVVPDEQDTDRVEQAHSLHARARQAVRLLVGRQVFLQFLALSGGIVVARVLGPGPIGLFGIALFVIYLVGLLADLGTRTALIRQQEAVSEEQLSACFTMQQMHVTLLVAGLFVLAPHIASLYSRTPVELVAIIRLLSLDLYLRSWRSMSEIRLERELRYRRLAVADVVGSSGYHTVAVILVLNGLGAQSLVWAMLAGNLLRVVLLYHEARWPIRFSLQGIEFVRLIRAGVPIQANQIIAQAPTWITPTLVAALIGAEAVGLLTWASTLGRKPREMLENVVRVSLPHFARLQTDLVELVRVLAKYVTLSLLACGLWLSVLLVAGRDLVEVVYTERWLPAVPALIVYAVSALPGSVRSLASAALIGSGRIPYATRASVVGGLVTISTSILLVVWIGFIGVPVGQLAGALVVTPILLKGLGSGVIRSVIAQSRNVVAPLVFGLAAGSMVMLLPLPMIGRLTAGAAVGFSYIAIAWRVSPSWLRNAVREEILTVRGRPTPPPFRVAPDDIGASGR